MIVKNMENEEEDVPEDFFDDFDKTDFLDPLTILDTWSGDTGEATEPEDKSENSRVNNENQKPKKVSKEKSLVKKSHENSSCLQRESRRSKSYERERKRSRSPIKRAASKDRSLSKRVRSRSNERLSRIRRRSTSLIRRSPVNRRRRRSDSSESRRRKSRSRGRRSRSISALRRSIRERENFLRRNQIRSRSRDRRIRSRSRERRISPVRNRDRSKGDDSEKNKDIKSREILLRRDPTKTKRDILRDKDKCAKNISEKRISQRLKAVETGLIPPGMELDVELDDIGKEPGEIMHQPGGDKRSNLSFSLSPSPSKVRRKDNYSDATFGRYSYKDKEDSLERKINRTLNDWYKSNSHLKPRRDLSNSRQSRSPTRKKTSFLDEINQKLSLTAEQEKIRHIQEKINGFNVDPILNNYPPVPSQNLTCSSYSALYHPQYPTGYTGMPYTATNYNQFPNHNPIPIQTSYDANIGSEYTLEKKLENSREKLKKMFTDDNVTLTDYLTASVRLALDHTTTVDIKNKIQVITRCQDALKLISDGSRPVGRLFYKKPNAVSNKGPQIKNQSPLKSVPCVRFYSTTKMKIDEKMKTPISRMLVKMGLKYLPPLQAETNEVTEEPNVLPPRRDLYLENRLMKMVQTDPMTCDECEYRKQKKMCNVGTQCGSGIGNTADFGVQVDVNDFHTARSALNNMIKTQSLASLTPAQLLAQLGTKEEKKEIFPLNRRHLDDLSISSSKVYKQSERHYGEIPMNSKDFPSGFNNPSNPNLRSGSDNFGPKFHYDQYMAPQPRRF